MTDEVHEDAPGDSPDDLTGPPTSLGDELDRVARVLWPAPGQTGHALHAARDAARQATSPTVERYAAVPSLRRPRYLLPLDAPPPTRARLLLAYNHLRSDRRRVQRLGLAGLAGVGLPRPRAGRGLLVADPPAGASLRARVAEALGTTADALVLAVGVRPGTGPLTPTVTVVDTDGHPRAFVKVADQPGTRAELDAEHAVLDGLRQPAGSGLLVPAPLFRFTWGGSLVVGIEPLPLDVRRVGADELAATLPHLETLVASRPTPAVDLASSPWTARLRAELSEVPDQWGAPLSAALEAAVTAHAGRPLAHGLRHGDWSPWNMAWSRSVGGLAVWDWEFSEAAAPLGLDRLNWHFANDTSVRGLSMTDAAARLRAASAETSEGATGDDRDLAELLLLDMAVRRAGQGAEGDETSAAYADELVTVLRDR